MTRSVWKGPLYDDYLLKKADAARKSGKTNQVIKIWTRRSTILPEFVGLTFGVYNGKKFIPVSVNESMVGHKFGEFSPTRTFNSHSAEKKTDTKPGTPPTASPGTAQPSASPGTAPAAKPAGESAPAPKEEKKEEK